MEISKTLSEAIENKNIHRIYSAFSVIAHEDPNFSTGKFDSILNYVKSKNIPGFFQKYDGEKFKPESEWSEKYWALVVSDLMDNFCEERISHLKDVGKNVYPLKNNISKETLPDNLKKKTTTQKVHVVISRNLTKRIVVAIATIVVLILIIVKLL